MRTPDLIALAAQNLAAARVRTALIVLAMSIGVAAVIALTALGEGARGYVTDQFAAIGRNLLIVLPGRAETAGGFPGAVMGNTPRDLTLDDAEALARLPGVARLSPLVVGEAEVQANGRLRDSAILGAGPHLLAIRHMKLAAGSFLSPGDERDNVCVLGAGLARELFGPGGTSGKSAPIGAHVRIGDVRLRVSGILDEQGQQMGFDSDKIAIVPVRDAMRMFDTASLFRVLIEAESRDGVPHLKQRVIDILRARHEGEADITVLTQDAVLATFDRIFTALTLALGGIAGISLSVAGILIMNVMLVTVAQRTREIGLIKALGGTRAQVRALILTETAMLALSGAALGLAGGYAGAWLLRLVYADLPAYPPLWAALAAPALAVVVGLLAALMPATRAARLDPVRALAGR
jgi:putative ABC transport system permease protein